VTETFEATPSAPAEASAETASRTKSGGLNSILLPELKQLAGSLGIKGAGAMRKGALIEAISAARSGNSSAGTNSFGTSSAGSNSAGTSSAGSNSAGTNSAATSPAMVTATVASSPEQTAAPSESSLPAEPATSASSTRGHRADNGQPIGDVRSFSDSGSASAGSPDTSSPPGRDNRSRSGQRNGQQSSNNQGGQQSSSRDRSQSSGNGQRQGSNSGQSQNSDQNPGGQNSGSGQNQSSGQSSSSNRDGYRDDDRGGRSRSRSRSRNRDRGSYRDHDRQREGGDREPQVNDDDVLIPAAGILDLLDNYAFVRTSGYLPGPNDVYVALSMVRKYGLRKGDAITGAVRQSREGERREKFNPMVRIDTVNGAEPDAARDRVEFSKLTPLYAADRLRLETEPGQLTTRLIDIVAPIGKGQRGLIVSPSKAGKTLVMQAIANAITTNNPECHLMVVLVDERPEEVTDMQRAVKGEVIASTFDRPADDHTTVAELAIERAKRLVELGHDVVVLLDSITRLGRAYNLAAPASGRILSGGVDSSALYPPKRFFGAARNIEDGGSLTILATALIETGSKMDEVIFEEFKGTGNLELRLRREYADKRIFPAIDVVTSGTRREELLMGKDELQIIWKLRRVLSALEGQQALELLLNKLKSTKTNIEFLMQVNKTTPTASGLGGSDDD